MKLGIVVSLFLATFMQHNIIHFEQTRKQTWYSSSKKTKLWS